MEPQERTFDFVCNGNNNSNTYIIETTTLVSDSANNTQYPDIPLIKQPTYMILLLSISYGTVLILALLGNSCVLAVVVRDKRFHSVTYLFIANLALADLLTAIFCNPITLMTNMFNGKYIFAYCFR